MADHLLPCTTAKPFQFHHRSISPHHHHTNAGNKLKFHLQFHQFTCKLITINHVLIIFSFCFAGLETNEAAAIPMGAKPRPRALCPCLLTVEPSRCFPCRRRHYHQPPITGAVDFASAQPYAVPLPPSPDANSRPVPSLAGKSNHRRRPAAVHHRSQASQPAITLPASCPFSPLLLHNQATKSAAPLAGNGIAVAS